MKDPHVKSDNKAFLDLEIGLDKDRVDLVGH